MGKRRRGAWWARYRTYMASPQWAALSAAIIRRDKGCRACGATDGLEVHHHTYDRFEHEHRTDLVTLCRPCHQAVHKLHDRQRFGKGETRTLTEVTFAYIKTATGGKVYSRAVMADHTPPVPPKPKREDGKRVVSMDRRARGARGSAANPDVGQARKSADRRLL